MPLTLQYKNKKKAKVMTKTRNPLYYSDKIFATLVVNGRIYANICDKKFYSINEIIRYVYSKFTAPLGMACLTIRNQTQGWCLTLPMATAAKDYSLIPRRVEPAPVVNEHGQYLIQW